MWSAILKKRPVSVSVPVILLTALSLVESGCTQATEEADLEQRADGLLYKIGSNEPFTGVRTKHHEVLDGRRKAYEIHYDKGLPKGPFDIFYPHGITKKKGIYIISNQESVRHGEFTEWRKNGTLIYKKSYRNGKLHGSFRLFHDKWSGEKRKASEEENQTVNDATIEYEATYRNGLPEGRYSRYQKNGSILEEGLYREGKFEDQQIYYYPKIELLAIRDPSNLHSGYFSATKEGFIEASEQALSLHVSTLSR
ncbi:MAG: hypothetical protein VCA36_09925, partial [Opitutales bacterium]